MLNSASCIAMCVCPYIQCNEIHAQWNAFCARLCAAAIQDDLRGVRIDSLLQGQRSRWRPRPRRRGKQSLTSNSEKFFKEILQLYPAPRTMSRNFFVVFEPKKKMLKEKTNLPNGRFLDLGNAPQIAWSERTTLTCRPEDPSWFPTNYYTDCVASDRVRALRLCVFALLGDVFDGSHEMTRFSKVPSALLMFWGSPSTTTTTTTADAWQTYNLGL